MYDRKLDKTVLWYCNFTYDYLNILLSFGKFEIKSTNFFLIWRSNSDFDTINIIPSQSTKSQASSFLTFQGSQPHKFLKGFLNYPEFEPSFLWKSFLKNGVLVQVLVMIFQVILFSP